MPRPKNPDGPKKHYSADVDSIGAKRLAEIQRFYGATPSGIASILLQTVANIGVDRYHVFMRRVKDLEAELIRDD